MYSTFAKLAIIISSFSPIFLSLWIVKTVNTRGDLKFYLANNSFSEFKYGMADLWSNHYLLVIFIFAVYVSIKILSVGIENLSIWTIQLKSIKPADIQFNAIILSYFLPFLKFGLTDIKDVVLLLIAGVIYIISAFIGKGVYHYNIIFRISGYRHYEVQTKQEVTFLMLSTDVLRDPSQVKKFIQFSDYMLIDVTAK